MELFSELKNKYVLSAIQLINSIHNGEKINKPEKAWRGVGDEFIHRLKTEYEIFEANNDDYLTLKIDSGIGIRPSNIEKIWLKEIISHESAKLFLSQKTIDLLKNRLEGTQNFIGDNIEIFGVHGHPDTIDENFIHKFRLILHAIDGRLSLIYSNKALDGTIYKNEVAIPLKIEYSTVQRKFKVAMWATKKNRPIKVNINSMFDVTLDPGEPTRIQYETVKAMVESLKAKKPLVLKVLNKKNAVERASMLFSQYERRVLWENGNKDVFVMEISYYRFEETELISDILSFGPLAVVVEPVGVRERVIDYLRITD